MFQQLYDEWLAKLSEKAAHVSGSFSRCDHHGGSG